MLNTRQEKFVSLYASGQAAAKAYGEAYGRAGHSAEASGARLLRNAEVQTALQELRANASQEAVMTLADILGRLRVLYETPISALNENHPLTRRITVRETGLPGQVMRSVRIVEKDSPLAILREMARLLGLDKKPASELAKPHRQPEARPVSGEELMAHLARGRGTAGQAA